MTDLDDILGSLDDDENEEVETEEEGGFDFLDDEEEEAPIAPKKASKKKASKKKVSRKVAPPPEPEEEEAPPRKKKVAKKAAAKPAPAPEPEEEAPAPKRRGPKPGVKRGPRKAAAAASSNDVLASLRDELNDIASGDAEKSRLAQLKADIRTASQLHTQLTRFAAKVEKAVEAQGATVEKLEAELAKLTAE